MDLYPDRFCNLVWHWLRIGADEKRVDQLERDLHAVPAGEAAARHVEQGAWSAESELAVFKAAARSTG